VLLAVISVIANQFNLQLLGWLFRNVCFFIVIAVGVSARAETADQSGAGQLSPFGRRCRVTAGLTAGHLGSHPGSQAISKTDRA
jgi:hypothetical protein